MSGHLSFVPANDYYINYSKKDNNLQKVFVMKNGLRMTHQREVILYELQKDINHPTVETLYQLVKKKVPHISIATVYRNLEVLSEAGIITKVEIGGRKKRFDRDLGQHNHIYCVQCNRLDNIEFEQGQKFSPTPEDDLGYQITGCRVEFFGTCPKCQENPRTDKKKGDC